MVGLRPAMAKRPNHAWEFNPSSERDVRVEVTAGDLAPQAGRVRNPPRGAPGARSCRGGGNPPSRAHLPRLRADRQLIRRDRNRGEPRHRRVGAAHRRSGGGQRPRKQWLDRLFQAPGTMRSRTSRVRSPATGASSASPVIASTKADRLLDITRMALSPKKGCADTSTAPPCAAPHFSAPSDTTSLIELLSVDCLWHYKRYAAKALAALGRTDEAIAYAESSRNPWAADWDINRVCEEILLTAGRVEEAYRRYGLISNTASTYVGTLRAVAAGTATTSPRPTCGPRTRPPSTPLRDSVAPMRPRTRCAGSSRRYRGASPPAFSRESLKLE